MKYKNFAIYKYVSEKIGLGILLFLVKYYYIIRLNLDFVFCRIKYFYK